MSVGILGGVAKGFNLATPKSFKTRPTSVLLKRRLFDSIQDFSGKIFIDLCAGSGSIGLESLSRGASEVHLVEFSNQALSTLKVNAKSLKQKYSGLGDYFLYKDDCLKWLKKNKQLLAQEGTYIFFDPPYDQTDLYIKFFEFIKSFNVKALIVVEGCTQKTFAMDEFNKRFSEPTKIFKQGTSFFAIYDFK